MLFSLVVCMSDDFWDGAEDFSVSPSEPDSAPSGVQNPYLTLFARVDVSFNGLVEELSDIDGVSTAPFDSYHLTVKQIGEFGEEQVSELVSNIDSTLDDVGSFEVSLGGVDVFPNCVYIPIQDSELLCDLHMSLCQLPNLEANGFEGSEYVPHVTVAKFTDASVDTEEVYDVLSNYAEKDWVDVTIDSIHLVKDKPVSETKIFPPFESIGKFELTDSDLEEDTS